MPRRSSSPGGGAPSTSRGRSWWSGYDARRGGARGDGARLRCDRGGDGARPDSCRAVAQHSGAPRLFGGAVRRRRRDDRPGRPHSGPSRRHGGVGRRGARARVPSPAGGRLHPQRSLHRRIAPSGHHADRRGRYRRCGRRGQRGGRAPFGWRGRAGGGEARPGARGLSPTGGPPPPRAPPRGGGGGGPARARARKAAAGAGQGNVNCPLAVARSAVLFVVRTLLPEDVPTNGGVGRAVRVTAPDGCLVNARHPSAVAAGNVETSQRIVDTLFLALARGGIPVPAQGQGTMNNVTFGAQRATGDEQRGGGVLGAWTYYETIGGGQGASPHAPGPSGVHVGMSNTRNTPIEVLEMEYPLRLKTYALRRRRGGVGRWAGGDGVIREFAALASMELSVLAERRRHHPAGAAGGGAGAVGRTILNGAPLAPKVSTLLEPGDVLRIETPGGGGWGTPQQGDDR